VKSDDRPGTAGRPDAEARTEAGPIVLLLSRGLFVSAARFDALASTNYAPYRKIPTSVSGWIPCGHGQRNLSPYLYNLLAQSLGGHTLQSARTRPPDLTLAEHEQIVTSTRIDGHQGWPATEAVSCNGFEGMTRELAALAEPTGSGAGRCKKAPP
jgi:hypothetical protein